MLTYARKINEAKINDLYALFAGKFDNLFRCHAWKPPFLAETRIYSVVIRVRDKEFNEDKRCILPSSTFEIDGIKKVFDRPYWDRRLRSRSTSTPLCRDLCFITQKFLRCLWESGAQFWGLARLPLPLGEGRVNFNSFTPSSTMALLMHFVSCGV